MTQYYFDRKIPINLQKVFPGYINYHGNAQSAGILY